MARSSKTTASKSGGGIKGRGRPGEKDGRPYKDKVGGLKKGGIQDRVDPQKDSRKNHCV